MFGYIKPNKMELKLKDIKRYSCYYCTLCDQLKKDYGVCARFILNYDITFLLVFLENIIDCEKSKRKVRCPYNPLHGKMSLVNESVVRYSAFINYWLVTEKVLDDYYDTKSIVKYILYKYLTSKRKYKRIKSKYKTQVDILSDKLRLVFEYERNVSDRVDFDILTNCFGDFFAEIFNIEDIILPDKKDDYKNEKYKRIFFNLGKWIYIMDAFDDYSKDVKKKRFNLLFALNEGKEFSKQEVFDYSLSLHFLIKKKIQQLMEKVSIDDDCIKNIITYGIDDVFAQITKKKYRECMRDKNDGNKRMEQLDTNN